MGCILRSLVLALREGIRLQFWETHDRGHYTQQT